MCIPITCGSVNQFNYSCTNIYINRLDELVFVVLDRGLGFVWTVVQHWACCLFGPDYKGGDESLLLGREEASLRWSGPNILGCGLIRFLIGPIFPAFCRTIVWLTILVAALWHVCLLAIFRALNKYEIFPALNKYWSCTVHFSGLWLDRGAALGLCVCLGRATRALMSSSWWAVKRLVMGLFTLDWAQHTRMWAIIGFLILQDNSYR